MMILIIVLLLVLLMVSIQPCSNFGHSKDFWGMTRALLQMTGMGGDKDESNDDCMNAPILFCVKSSTRIFLGLPSTGARGVNFHAGSAPAGPF